MARLLAMTTLTVVALCLVAAGAAAYDENHAFRAPVVELPQLAKSEPIEFGQIASGRRLLRADPSKSLWDKKLGVRRDTDTRFGQGVASGDPFTGSVILWTRVTPASNRQNRPAAVDWAVSKDRTFAKRKIISRGTTFTSKDVDFTVKVDAKRLKPDTKYFYQFRYRTGKTTVYSEVGATRTIPLADDDIGRARIAFFGCSNLPVGFFTAYGQVARDAAAGKIDYNIHTGDYLYEYATNGSSLFSPEDRAARTTQPFVEILSVSDYRIRYNQYNSDVDTKAMRASAPLIPVWDDHEYANNAWKDGAQNHQPATEGDWNERRLRALQVYYEMMPIRQANADNKQQIYRNFEIGKLLKLIMLDTRVIGRDVQNATDASNPDRTILGAPQKQYLKDQLLAANGKQTWKVLGQQVLFAHRCDKASADQWDGYRQDRFDVLDHLEKNKIDNTLILTGDIHQHFALDLPKYPCKGEANFSYDAASGKGSLAVELVSSSITSGYNPSGKAAADARAEAALAANPHMKFSEGGFNKGYAILDIRRNQATTTWYYAPELTKAGQYESKVMGPSWKVVKGTNHLVQA